MCGSNGRVPARKHKALSSKPSTIKKIRPEDEKDRHFSGKRKVTPT
jgi:hypothetical protein